MPDELQLGYLGLEVPDLSALDGFLTEVVGLVHGDRPSTWRNDDKAQRIFAAEGPSGDATFLGFEAADPDSWASTVDRLEGAGYPVVHATADEANERSANKLAYVNSPWNIRVEIVLGLSNAARPFSSPLVKGGFVTGEKGFGHVVFATTAFDESHHFVTEGLGLRQTDWVETEIAAGIELEIRFYHCNPRHHSLALARAPFDLPQRLHHFMVEVVDRDDVGYAFDRAWNTGYTIASGLGHHPNDQMFSFYVASPTGFQVEIGHGARLVTKDWDGNRCYDRISTWGHQPIPAR